MGAGGALIACRVGLSKFASATHGVPESRAQKRDKRLGMYERANLRNRDSDRPKAPPLPFHTLILDARHDGEQGAYTRPRGTGTERP